MRQKYELAGIIVEFGNDLVNNSNLNSFQVKVLSNIARCRTAALGGHEDQCDNCGKSRYSYNSCRDRHCPKCQAAKQAFRIEDLINTTLPIKHYHIVFTVPHILNKICLYNNRWFYDQLFASVWDTLRTFGYTHFGVGSGAVCMLHTWDRNLSLHTHIHCIVPAAGFSLDGKWKNIGGTGKFLYPVYQLSDTFQGKFIDSIKRRLRKENLLSEFDAVLQQAWNKKWVVNCEPSLAKAEHVVKYLGQYTHRVAITNQRILNIDKSGVTFITKDYRDRALKKPVHMDGVEFLRRFCLHILPYRFVKIRRYGIYNPTLKRNLKLQFVSNTEIGPLPAKKENGKPKETVQERFLRLTGVDVYQCPFCKKGKMHVVKELPRVRSPDIFNISAQAVCSR